MAEILAYKQLMSCFIKIYAGTTQSIIMTAPSEDITWLFDTWIKHISLRSEIQHTLILSHKKGEILPLKASMDACIAKIPKLKIMIAHTRLEHQIISENESLILPYGPGISQLETAGVYAKYGMRDQKTLIQQMKKMELVYVNKPLYKKRFLGIIRTYESPELIVNKLDKYFNFKFRV